MEFGVAFASSTESWRWARRAEELGFRDAWFYDTQLLNPDIFVCMALAAANTSTIGLGTGVLIPSNRIAPVAANGLASLNRIAPGRIRFGVGTGFTGRRTMGLDAIRLAEMEDYVNVFQAMLRGEEVDWKSPQGARTVRFLNPDLGLINIDDDVPLYVSAFGEKSRKMTARLGGGWLNFSGQVQDALASITDMRLSWKQESRHTDDLHSVLFSLGCVLAPGEVADSARARAQAGPMAAVFYHNVMESLPRGAAHELFPADLAERIEAYRDLYEKYEQVNAR
ncbi:MAG: LLM class flavin-dependent oxidoreductase, partial [Pseudomonadales bacterium]|nr:LLM class flavin-dependent oxidoreductase [Pseudomonadales bacterium]